MSKRSAFSLVELSIVLVILGLLTGGILAGQSLIKAAELRAITTEYNRWKTATGTFRDKYFALPGDMTNATKFWGDNNAACPDAGTPNGTPGTCNGNGDGMYPDIFISHTTGATREPTQFWNQLALAGLIEGSYSGVLSATNYYTTGENTPASRYSSASWSLVYTFDFVNPSTVYLLAKSNYANMLSGSNVDVLLSEEAWNIDTKMDDGRPNSGMVGAYMLSSCYNAAGYVLSPSTTLCTLGFKQL